MIDGRRVRHRADLLRELVARDLRLRYRRSVLGVAWSQLSPLVLLGVLTFVFRKVVPLDIPHYALFVYVGLLAWTWFSGALSGVTGAIVDNRDLVRRPGFPVALLPVSTSLTHVAYFTLAMPVVLIATQFERGLSVTLLALPLIALVQFLVVLGPGYLLASLEVEFRDVGHLIAVALIPMFYATPVFYSAAQVPARYRTVYGLNPVNRLITAYRDVVVDGRWPDPVPLLVLAVASTALVVVGRRVFERGAHRFAEQLG